MQNATREFLLCRWCSRILMSIGNRGSQNFNKQRSQRVGSHSCIGWVFSFCMVFIERVQPCTFMGVFLIWAKKKRSVANLFGSGPGYMDHNTHFHLFLINISIWTSFPTGRKTPVLKCMSLVTMKLLETKNQNSNMTKRSYWAGHIRNVWTGGQTRLNVLIYSSILYTVTANFKTAAKARNFLSQSQFTEH